MTEHEVDQLAMVVHFVFDQLKENSVAGFTVVEWRGEIDNGEQLC